MRLKRVPQPPINPLTRDPELHDFWPAFIVAVISAVLIVSSLRHRSPILTQDGNAAWEQQLTKAIARGGLQFAATPPPPDFSNITDPAAAAAAMNRAAAAANLPLLQRYRVNTGAAAPCPT
jgi:hypothetical protein